MLQHHHPRHAAEEETAQRADPAARHRPAEERREHEAHRHADPLHVLVLPTDERVLLEVRHVLVRRVGIELEEQPADVREEETLVDGIRVILVIDVLVVVAVFAAPHEHGILERRRAEEQREELHRPLGLEGHVRETAGGSRA